LAVRAVGGSQRGLHVVGGADRPHVELGEVVENALLRVHVRGEGQCQQADEPPHPFTLPAISPSMYWRCSARNSTSTGSTVTTDPAIISSLSWTCSRERPARAT